MKCGMPFPEWPIRLPKQTTVSMTGKRKTGFIYVGDERYYLINRFLHGFNDEDYAVLAKGWNTIDNRVYYMDPDTGAITTGFKTIDGAKYHFAANGVMDNAWAVIGGKTYHFTGGKMDTGWKTIVNRTYYFHPNGVKQECDRVTIDGKVCAFGNNGVLSSRNSSISDVVRYAKQWEGKIPYKSSVTGNDKNDERKLELKEGRGSDCSWFVFHCLEKFGYLTEHVHSYEWGSKPSRYEGGKEIGKDLSKARPGDVICYKYGNGKRTPQNSHVSIYIGDGKEVHCAGDTNGKGGVVISKVNKKDIYNIVRFN